MFFSENRCPLFRNMRQSLVSSHDLVRKVCNFSGSGFLVAWGETMLIFECGCNAGRPQRDWQGSEQQGWPVLGSDAASIRKTPRGAERVEPPLSDEMRREGERTEDARKSEVADIEPARIGAEGRHHEAGSIAREASSRKHAAALAHPR